MSGRSINDEAELYPYLGELVYQWSKLEFLLSMMLGAVMGITATEASGLFYSAVGNRTRFDMLDGVILSRLPIETGEGVRLREQAKSIVDKARKLNGKRNTFIHSLYIASPEGVCICDVGPVLDAEGEIVTMTANTVKR